ncbi:NAD-dependent epimerase/dehydratase family protein [Azospirillum canadense]|uniref:NAD-dependent epimerase/dehydratase family protein n=1 Tax=Azospirillum canadense TaxID=403962 RepID=UPI0022262E89|nr:NAD-dependent epimerase/dehydratase family protein [Azospirillum canadense]MCW2240917.1 UDP-glucose 4-epimerase [Azospirillum canadense]
MANLEGKSILVTGGAGFVGSHIVDLLVEERCHKIVVVDNMVRGCPQNLARAIAQGPVELVEGDIRDRTTMGRLVAEADIVFHQAALRITHCAAEPRLAFEVMAEASFDLLTMCAEHGIEKVVAASSASIYGMATAFPTDENHHPYDNRTLYGAAKLFNEGLLRSFNDMYGLNYVALRYFNVYGPRMDIHGKYTEVLIRWMERIAAGQSPIIFGDGSQTMDLIHVTDVARANILAAKSPAHDDVFNVGSGTEVSLAQLAKRLAVVMGKPELDLEFAAERKINPVPRRQAGTHNAARLLGFEASVDLDKGLRALVEWWGRERLSVLAEAAP